MEISINEACHENWTNMTPNGQGAFCSKCVKTVIDFTDKSLEEIKSFFAGRGQESTCGRFEDKQLSALSFDAFFERFRNFEFTKRFAVILFFTFGLGLFGVSTATAQSDSLVMGFTTVKNTEEPKPTEATTFTTITVEQLKPQITIGAVSIIQPLQKFDWNTITLVQPVWVKAAEKKTGQKPAPLKRESVYRRRD